MQFGLINFGQWIGFEPFAPYADGQGDLTLVPAIAFFIAILGFNLLAEGLRRANQRLTLPALPETPGD